MKKKSHGQKRQQKASQETRAVRRAQEIRGHNFDGECNSESRLQGKPAKPCPLRVDRASEQGQGDNGRGQNSGGVVGRLIEASRIRLASIKEQLLGLQEQLIEEEAHFAYLLDAEQRLARVAQSSGHTNPSEPSEPDS